jgi:hypothetical protein
MKNKSSSQVDGKCVLYLMCGLLATVLGSDLSNAALAQTMIANSGATSVHAKSAKGKIEVVFHTVRIESGSDAFPIVEWDAKALTLIKKLEFTVEGKRVFVPRSVFADLLDVRTASIESQKGDSVLKIAGGDGSESYFVHVYFDATKVKRRMLYSSLAPLSVAEDTHYRLTVLKDE